MISVLSIGLILVLMFSSVINAHCATYMSVADKKAFAFDFLENIVGVNMSVYPSPGVIVTGENDDQLVVRIILSNDVGWYEALFLFDAHTLDYYTMYAWQGALVINDKGRDCLNIANLTLEKYQALYSKSYCEQFIQTLADVSTPLRSQTIQASDILFTLVCSEEHTIFGWGYCINGTHAAKGLTIHVSKNGYVECFSDTWERFQIATTHVEVSKEQAIEITLAKAEKAIKEIGAKIATVNASFSYALDKDGSRGNKTLVYPIWGVEIMFDKWYKSCCGYAASIWADTGEIRSAGLQGAFRPQNGTSIHQDSPDLAVPLGFAVFAAAFIGGSLIVAYKKPASRRLHEN